MQLAPYPGNGAGQIDVPNGFLPPSWAHPFGTDELGRDVFSRVILGARYALIVSVLVVGIAVAGGRAPGRHRRLSTRTRRCPDHAHH